MQLDLEHPHIHPSAKASIGIINGLKLDLDMENLWALPQWNKVEEREAYHHALIGRVESRLERYIAEEKILTVADVITHGYRAAMATCDLSDRMYEQACAVARNLKNPSEATYREVGVAEQRSQAAMMDLFDLFKGVVRSNTAVNAEMCLGSMMKLTIDFSERDLPVVQTGRTRKFNLGLPWSEFANELQTRAKEPLAIMSKLSARHGLMDMAYLYEFLPDDAMPSRGGKNPREELRDLLFEMPAMIKMIDTHNPSRSNYTRYLDDLGRIRDLLKPVEAELDRRFEGVPPEQRITRHQVLKEFLPALDEFCSIVNKGRDFTR